MRVTRLAQKTNLIEHMCAVKTRLAPHAAFAFSYMRSKSAYAIYVLLVGNRSSTVKKHVCLMWEFALAINNSQHVVRTQHKCLGMMYDQKACTCHLCFNISERSCARAGERDLSLKAQKRMLPCTTASNMST